MKPKVLDYLWSHPLRCIPNGFHISSATIYHLMRIIQFLSDEMNGFKWIRDAYKEFSGWTSGTFIVHVMYYLRTAQYVQIPKCRLKKKFLVYLTHLKQQLFSCFCYFPLNLIKQTWISIQILVSSSRTNYKVIPLFGIIGIPLSFCKYSINCLIGGQTSFSLPNFTFPFSKLNVVPMITTRQLCITFAVVGKKLIWKILVFIVAK